MEATHSNSPQITVTNSRAAPVQLVVHSSIRIDSCGNITADARTEGPMTRTLLLKLDVILPTHLTLWLMLLLCCLPVCYSRLIVDVFQHLEMALTPMVIQLLKIWNRLTPVVIRLLKIRNHLTPVAIVEGQEMEATHSNSDTTIATCGEFSVDKLGHQHYRAPCTGPRYIYIAYIHSSTCQTHANDMLPQLKAVVEEGRTAVVIIVDSGPDWSPGSLFNNLFFFRLWRDAGLDMLVNPIEHLWSPLSKKFCGIQFLPKLVGIPNLPVRCQD